MNQEDLSGVAHTVGTLLFFVGIAGLIGTAMVYAALTKPDIPRLLGAFVIATLAGMCLVLLY